MRIIHHPNGGYTVHADAIDFGAACVTEAQKAAAVRAGLVSPSVHDVDCMDCGRPARVGFLCDTCRKNADENERDYDNPVTRWGC